MIGANGTGKSSVLEIMAVVASSAQGQLSASMTYLGGLNSVLSSERADDLHVAISMDVPSQASLEYSLGLTPRGVAYAITDETLIEQRRTDLHPFRYIDSHDRDIRYLGREKNEVVRPNWDHNVLETSLAQVPKMFREPEEMRSRLSSFTFYHVLNVDSRSPVRLPQQMQPATLPGRNGEELVSCLFYLRETERHRFEAIEDALHAAFPNFERLEFPPVAAGTLALAWREKGFSKPFYMHQLSDGTLRFLWLATLLQSPGLTAITLLDEPEVSLHPQLLAVLADLFREASRRTQLIVATHSDRLIGFLKPEEVLLLDSTEVGMTTVTRADELDLDKWLKDYSLDELWRNGLLGARI